MQTTSKLSSRIPQKFPSFDLKRLLMTCFAPRKGEKLCILIDLENPSDIKNFAFLNNPGHEVQKKAYHIFYQGFHSGLLKELGLSVCDMYAYKTTGGSNLELPETAMSPEGKIVNLRSGIYAKYDLIFCITDYSATAPMTATAKEYGFRGATMHGMNDLILQTGLAVDYNIVSKETEALRKGMSGADSVDIDFEVEGKKTHLHIDLEKQEAQKSHGICRIAPDIANLPAGEVYFVPKNASGTFPVKFDDGTLAMLSVKDCCVQSVSLIRGDQKTIDEIARKLEEDPSSGILGELGFGTQIVPFSGRDIQDEKIFGTFHLATGRNDHLNGDVTLDQFHNKYNATHDDLLFSPDKTPEIKVIKVSMKRKGKDISLIENYEPTSYLWSLRESV